MESQIAPEQHIDKLAAGGLPKADIRSGLSKATSIPPHIIYKQAVESRLARIPAGGLMQTLACK
jgi:hypothetical protein